MSLTDTLRQDVQAALTGRYEIEREVGGGGGMSRVFVAEETRFRRRVVIKVLAPELAAGLSIQRFEREVAVAATAAAGEHRGCGARHRAPRHQAREHALRDRGAGRNRTGE